MRRLQRLHTRVGGGQVGCNGTILRYERFCDKEQQARTPLKFRPRAAVEPALAILPRFSSLDGHAQPVQHAAGRFNLVDMRNIGL